MRYPALELGQPGNPKCPDKYTEEASALTPDCTRVLLQVSAQAVFVQFGVMPHGRSLSLAAVVWQHEEPLLPMIAAFSRPYDAVRVRNYTKGAEAQFLASFL